MADRSQSFKTGAGNKKVDTPPGKFSEKRKEIARLKIVLDSQNFIPEDVLNEAHCRFINEAAEALGLAGNDLVRQLARQVCDLDGFLREQVYEAVASRMLLLREEVEEAREKDVRDEGGGKEASSESPALAEEPVGNPGVSTEDVPEGRETSNGIEVLVNNATGKQATDSIQTAPPRQSTRNKGGLDSRIDPLRWELDRAIAAAHQADQEDLQECKEAFERPPWNSRPK
jgi:hypothetical protein